MADPIDIREKASVDLYVSWRIRAIAHPQIVVPTDPLFAVPIKLVLIGRFAHLQARSVLCVSKPERQPEPQKAVAVQSDRINRSGRPTQDSSVTVPWSVVQANAARAFALDGE